MYFKFLKHQVKVQQQKFKKKKKKTEKVCETCQVNSKWHREKVRIGRSFAPMVSSHKHLTFGAYLTRGLVLSSSPHWWALYFFTSAMYFVQASLLPGSFCRRWDGRLLTDHTGSESCFNRLFKQRLHCFWNLLPMVLVWKKKKKKKIFHKHICTVKFPPLDSNLTESWSLHL